MCTVITTLCIVKYHIQVKKSYGVSINNVVAQVQEHRKWQSDDFFERHSLLLITDAVIVSAIIFIGECDKIAPANLAKGRCSITCLGCDSY